MYFVQIALKEVFSKNNTAWERTFILIGFWFCFLFYFGVSVSFGEDFCFQIISALSGFPAACRRKLEWPLPLYLSRLVIVRKLKDFK